MQAELRSCRLIAALKTRKTLAIGAQKERENDSMLRLAFIQISIIFSDACSIYLRTHYLHSFRTMLEMCCR
jgi:hypothetical protein